MRVMKVDSANAFKLAKLLDLDRELVRQRQVLMLYSTGDADDRADAALGHIRDRCKMGEILFPVAVERLRHTVDYMRTNISLAPMLAMADPDALKWLRASSISASPELCKTHRFSLQGTRSMCIRILSLLSHDSTLALDVKRCIGLATALVNAAKSL